MHVLPKAQEDHGQCRQRWKSKLDKAKQFPIAMRRKESKEEAVSRYDSKIWAALNIVPDGTPHSLHHNLVWRSVHALPSRLPLAADLP